MKYRVYFLFIIFFPVYSFSQETNLSEQIISIAEELASDESDPETVSLYIEKLYEIYENPVRINNADDEETDRLFFLSDFQVRVLSDYVNSSGKLMSVYEIANLPGFDRETAMMMMPFISLDATSVANVSYSSWRNIFLTNIIWKPGDKDTSLNGSPVRVLTKYRFNAGGFSGGFTAEKDPGEELLYGNPPLPDLLSGYASWNGKGFVRRMIIGDYSARFGQGTNINTSVRTGLSLHAPGYMSARNEIRPYTSTDENNFFRGAASEFSFRQLSVTLFYSINPVDASLSSGADDQFIKSFYTSGLHNTTSSLMKKDAINDMVYGLNLSYNLGKIRVGATWSEQRFSLPVKPESDGPETIFGFTGNSNTLYSLYYNSLISRILLFGEYSLSKRLKYALVQGLTIRPSDRISVNLLYRHYEEGYFSFHGSGPGGASTSGTGKSILGNFIFEAAKHLFISGGCNISEYPWLRYRASSPSWKINREIRVRFIPSEKLLLESAYYYNMSTADNTGQNRIPRLKELTIRSFSATFRYSIYENLTLGTRIHFKLSEHSESCGMLMFQEVNYRFTNLPLTIWMRYSLFNTDDWDTRIYTYENDLLYSFSIPALYGKGSRNYLMAAWKIGDKGEVRFKYGIILKPQAGNNRTSNEEFRFQLRLFI